MKKSRYYIGTGEGIKMYTLRCIEECAINGENFDVDFYVRNLSIDKQQAYNKAKELGYDVVEIPQFDLEQIRRRKSDEIEAQRQREAAEREHQALQRELEQISMIASGYFPFGRWKDEKIDHAPESYLAYWIKQSEIDEPQDNVIIAIVKMIDKLCPHVRENIKLANGNGKHFGEIKKRYKTLRGKMVAKFWFETFYEYQNITKIVLESGELLVYKGATDYDFPEGEYVKFAATVKEHTEYEGIEQTTVQRIKLL